jgi:hypothetical protein
MGGLSCSWYEEGSQLSALDTLAERVRRSLLRILLPSSSNWATRRTG